MDLSKRVMPERKFVLTIFTALLISGAAVTANTVITNDNPDGYDLAVDTLDAQNINPTNATFRAQLSEKDDIYDAALIYWNYTDTQTGETYKGPVNIGLSQGETLKGTQIGLDQDTGYTVEAYSEPIVWEDQTLVNNIGDKSEGRKNEWILSNQDVMNAVFGSENLKNDVFNSYEDSGSDVQRAIVDFTRSDYIYLRADGSNNLNTANAYIETAENIDFTGKNTLKVDWVLNLYHDGENYAEAEVFVGGDSVYRERTGYSFNTDEVRNIDVSSISGSKNVKIQVRSKEYQNTYAIAQVYNLYLE